ncbi:MAG: PD40 domain-containing protein [Chromatiaceae bacterium]|nr:PD40 domain-containing protein [Chromatiaceae bacterium]
MYTGKWVWRLIAVTVIASSAACGGGGSGGAAPGTGEINGDLPNMGLQGTLYYFGTSGFESIDLTNPVIKNMGVGRPPLLALSTSNDGTEHTLNIRTDQVFFEKIVIMDNHEKVISSFSIESYATGLAQQSPDKQFIAAGVEPYGFYNIPYGRARELRIYDRSGTILRDIEDDEENNWIHSSWAWTQDGRLLISFSKRGLYILDDVLGSQPRLLKSFMRSSDSITTPLYMTVSPDNTKVAFTLYDDRQLYVMNLDGTGLVQITKSDITVITGGIAWSPDGQFLAVTAASFPANICLGRDTLLIRSVAKNAELPDLWGHTNPEYTWDSPYNFQSDDVFQLEYVSDSGYLIHGLCVHENLSWR